APATVAALLALCAAAALLTLLPEIRVRNLQGMERLQVMRLTAIAGTTLVTMLATAWLPRSAGRSVGGALLVALAAGDLVQAHRGFNPTVPRADYYPSTDGLDWLRTQAAGARIAPVDGAANLVEGHVWSMYGLSTVTGFDFHGDPDYQAFLRLAQQPPGVPAPTAPTVWDFVGLRRDSLDLRMLGALGVRFVVGAPVDGMPRSGGYVAIGPIGDGRVVRFTVPIRFDGLRRIDLLTATYARANRGRWHWTVADDRGATLASGVVDQSRLRDNDWWRLEWQPLASSAGRTVTVTVTGEGSGGEDSATLLATATPALSGTRLQVDGRADPRGLWFRSISTAPERFGDAELVFAGDLNVYRNPWVQPRAWFVDRVTVAEPSAQASAMHTGRFDPAHEAWLSATPAVSPATTASVTSIRLGDDRVVVGLDAPDGGVLIVGERAHREWTATIDGRAVPWQVSNAVLIGVAVPPGSRTLILSFSQPILRLSLGISLLAVVGITFASLLTVRRHPTPGR
nr:hypothetical protein [Acidobacteriota bacterium]